MANRVRTLTFIERNPLFSRQQCGDLPDKTSDNPGKQKQFVESRLLLFLGDKTMMRRAFPQKKATGTTMTVRSGLHADYIRLPADYVNLFRKLTQVLNRAERPAEL